MSTVQVHATGEVIDADTEVKATYYQGEANTVGGYTVDGVEYPAKIDESDFDPNGHNLDEIAEHMAQSTPREQARVLALEAEGKARKTLVGDEPVVEQVDPAPADAPVDASVIDTSGAHAAPDEVPQV